MFLVLASFYDLNDDVYTLFYLKLVCENTQYRPTITNEQNASCGNYLGGLYVKKCGLLWQDLDPFGEFVPLAGLYLEDCKDGMWDEQSVETDYWKTRQDLRGGNETGIMDSQIEPGLIPNRLRLFRSLTIISMDHIPEILQGFIWPTIYSLTFTNSQLFSQCINSHVRIILPSLSKLEVTSCHLTQPHLLFISDDDTLVLPGFGLFIWGFTSLSTLYRSYHDG